MLKQYQTIYLPRGVFSWPKLTEPDTKWKPEGEYSVKVVMGAAEFAPIKAALIEFAEAKRAEYIEQAQSELKDATDGKKKKALKDKIAFLQENDPTIPGTPEVDDDGNETDRVEVKCSRIAQRKDKKTGEMRNVPPPPLFDAAGKEIKRKVSIWGGSEGVVAATVTSYCTPKAHGVKLGIGGVQIIVLKSSGGGEAPKFGAVEGGYEDSGEEEGGAPAFPAADAGGGEGADAEDEEDF